MPTMTHSVTIPVSRIDDTQYVDNHYELALRAAWRELGRTWPEDTWQAMSLHIDRPHHDEIEYMRYTYPFGEVRFQYTFTVLPLLAPSRRADDWHNYIETRPHIYDRPGGHRVVLFNMSKRKILDGLWFRLRYFLLGPVMKAKWFLDGRHEQTMKDIDSFCGREVPILDTARMVQELSDAILRMGASLGRTAEAVRFIEDALIDEFRAEENDSFPGPVSQFDVGETDEEE